MVEPQDELGMLCAIDGHDWITIYRDYGLMFGPRQTEIHKTCSFCKEHELTIFRPYENPIPLSRLIWPL